MRTTRVQGETKVTRVSNCAQDASVSFDISHMSHLDIIWMQPMRVAKLNKRIVVDASN